MRKRDDQGMRTGQPWSSSLRVSLEIFDPSNFSRPLVREVLETKPEDPLVVSFEVDEHWGRFVFKGDAWPEDMIGETGAPSELRDQWKEPGFVYATQWLGERSSSQFERLREHDMENYLAIKGYLGIIPRPLLQRVVDLGLDLDVLGPESKKRSLWR